MKPTRQRRVRNSAFSLSEVTIALGIVVMLMLPVLAMLAGGGSLERLSRDREAASRIARTLVAGTRADGGGGRYRVDLSGEKTVWIDSPGGGAENEVYLLFGEGGLFLGEVGEDGYRQGVAPAVGGGCLVRIRVSGSDGGGAGNGWENWDVFVERPAAAARDSRESELFQTRFARP
ncbi:MAG: hypothetical protein GXX91_10735 [Verrucomicrobiaceae bacterium]|nr:hypothetical protein [Verrucomicrobiaceae bacterium]